MRIGSRLALIVVACLALTAAWAQSPVGTWTGKVDVSGVKPKDAKEKAQMEQAKGFLSSMSFKLQLKGDKTYLFTPIYSGKPQKAENGKWSQSGRTVSVTDPKGKVQKLILSSDGKKMINTPGPEEKGPKGMKLVFVRA